LGAFRPRRKRWLGTALTSELRWLLLLPNKGNKFRKMELIDRGHAISEERIYEPLKLGGALPRNRLALALVTRCMAKEDGTPTAAADYRRFARNRVGPIMTEATYVPSPASQSYLGQPVLATLRRARVGAHRRHG
jgi:hypothetical protein